MDGLIVARRRKLKSLADFQRALKQKYGLGEKESYKPWIRVQDIPSKGNSGKIDGIKTNRVHHTLSEHESSFFYLAEFCDSVIDIREQFPLLPLDLSVKIAQQLGVSHPIIVSSKNKEFNVMTTDFLLTRTDGQSSWFEAVSVKPVAELTNKRTAEKLDIERVWWELLGVPFHLYIMTENNKIQSKNIQWFTTPIRQNNTTLDYSLINAAKLLVPLGVLLIEDICNDFIHNLNIEHDDALVLLKILFATKEITVNLDKPIGDIGIVEVIKNNKDISRQ